MGNFNRVKFEEELAQFSGTYQYYKHYVPNVKYTDAVQYVAEECGAYWLIDVVASYQTTKFRNTHEFQVWKLQTFPSGKGVVICEDGNENEILRQEIRFTDFPLQEMTFFCANGVIYHPNEH